MGQRPHNAPDVPFHELLQELGYGGQNEGVARQALEEAGLTRPGKQGIATSKRDRVVATLRGRFLLACSRTSCQRAARQALCGKTLLLADRPPDCEICNGSENRLAVDRLCAAFARKGIRKLVVVGGSPSARQSLSDLVGDRLQLRLVDGVTRRTKAEARTDLLWADLVVVWGGTQLDHKVSVLYTDAGDGRVMSVHKRGIAALAEELLASPRSQ